MKLIIKLFIYLFKMARKILDLGTTYDDLSADKLRDALSDCNDNFEELYDVIIDDIQSDISSIESDVLALQAIQVVEILLGQWDMDATAFKTFAYVVPTGYHILSFDVMIKNDTEAEFFQINTDTGSGSAGYVTYNASTGFTVTRVASGIFDSTSFDDPNINRGYIMVTLKKN